MDNSRTLPIVLLPGLDGTGELLQDLADRLKVSRPVNLMSYPLEREMSYDQLVAFVVERAPTGPFVIVGESYSGPIAIEIAAIDPRVAGLVLASSFARHPLPMQLAGLAQVIDLRWVPKRIVTAALMGGVALPEIEVRLHRVLARLPRKIVQARSGDALRVDKRDYLRRTKCPLLCLHGRRDHLVRKKSVDEVIHARPDGQVRWIDGPHMLLATHAEQAAEVINGFCVELEPGRS